MARHTRHWIGQVSALALCAALVLPAQAGSDHASGDGSGADNERLLPGVYPAEPVLDSGDWLREPYDPFFDVDWSVALRGTYTKATSGPRIDTVIAPSVTLTHQGSRSAATIDADADITRSSEGEIDVTGLRLGLEAGYQLDSVTTLTATGDFSLTQDLPGTPGLGSDVAVAPQTYVKSVGLGIERQFGKFTVGVTGDVTRYAYGPTTLTNGTTVDNSAQNLWSLNSGLRVGFQATPIFEVFGEAGLGRDVFDVPSSVLLVKPDANQATIRGGVTGSWNGILTATGSVGLAQRQFDDASIDETIAHLYDASIVFTPDPTLRMSAGLTTTVAPPGPGSSGTTRIEHGANAQVDYTVNSWLALRAMADWSTASFTGSTDTETGKGWGLGATYAVNAHTDLSADYGYDYVETTTDGAEEAHRVTVGITISR